MLRVTACVIGLAVIACGEPDRQRPPQQSAAISLTDIAGRWRVEAAVTVGGESGVATYELVARADTSGWTMHLAGRAPIPVRLLAVASDSIVMHAGPYASFLRAGEQITAHTVARVQGGKLVGTSILRFSPPGADSVATFRIEGTRVP